MRKKRIAGIFAAIILVGLALWLVHAEASWRNIVKRCTDYAPHWPGMLDCYGLVSIWQPDNSGYLVQNNARPGSIIAQIKTADAFIVEGDEMYLIDITPV